MNEPLIINDLYEEIMLNLDIPDLLKMCSVNNYIQNICFNRSFLLKIKTKLINYSIYLLRNDLIIDYIRLILTFGTSIHIDFRLWYFPEFDTLNKTIKKLPFLQLNNINLNQYEDNKELELQLKLSYNSIYFLIYNVNTKQYKMIGSPILIDKDQFYAFVNYVKEGFIWYDDIIISPVKQKNLRKVIINLWDKVI